MKTNLFLMMVFLFSQSVFAYKDKLSCDAVPSACQENSTPQVRRPSYSWKLGPVEGEPGMCWWTCDIKEKNIESNPSTPRGVTAVQVQGKGGKESAVLAQMDQRLKNGDAMGYQYAEPGCQDRPEKGPYEFLETNHNGYLVGKILISEDAAKKFIAAHPEKSTRAGFQCSDRAVPAPSQSQDTGKGHRKIEVKE